MYLLYRRSLFLHRPSRYCLVSFILICKTSFSISCRTYLVEMNPLRFSLSGNVLISLPILKNSGVFFARYRIPSRHFFSLQHFIYKLITFWHPRGLMLIILIRIPFMWQVTSVLVFSRFYLYLCPLIVWL